MHYSWKNATKDSNKLIPARRSPSFEGHPHQICVTMYDNSLIDTIVLDFQFSFPLRNAGAKCIASLARKWLKFGGFAPFILGGTLREVL